MPLMTASSRFVRAYRLPIRATSISAGIVYTDFATFESGGLIAEDGGIPLYYITAPFLLNAISKIAEEIGLSSAGLLPLSSYLSRFFNEKSSLHGQIRDLLGDIAAVPILPPELRVDGDEPESNTVDSVSAVRASNGERAGWYFSNARLLETVQTPSPTFKCKNYGHPNYYTDHNKCRVCGGPIF
jgi:hypothetical protein